MFNYIFRRLLQIIPIVLGITFLSFTIMYFAGGNAVEILLENQGLAVSQEVLNQKIHELGLDRPFFVQYFGWLIGFFSGDLGRSYVSGNDVFAVFTSKLPATIILTLISLLLTLVISIPLGIYSALKHNKLADYIIRAATFIGNSLPNFFVALLLIFIFAISLGWLPAISSKIGSSGLSSLSLKGALLPSFTLAIAMSSKYIRQIRALILDELSKDYISGAKARGIPKASILIKDVLKNSWLMIITLLALSAGDLLGGTAIIETIFQWDGVGKLAVDAIEMRDYPIIQMYVVWMALIYLFINLITDLSYVFIDPRVKLNMGRDDERA